jgi:hypothetical protein
MLSKHWEEISMLLEVQPREKGEQKDLIEKNQVGLS